LIDIGGRKLQMIRSGQGSPTVIFENGLGGRLDDLRRFISGVAAYTSVVCYARAGNVASDPAAGPGSVAGAADDLQRMLDRAGIKPPYVLVGYSVGVLFSRGFAMKHPGEVSGLVFVEGTPERYLLDLQRIDPAGAARSFKQLGESNAAGFADQKGPPGVRSEWTALYQILLTGDLGIPGGLPNVPMAVISGLRPDGSDALAAKVVQMKREEHDSLFKLSTNGMRIVTSKSGHDVFQREPELVATAIKWVVEASRPH
jgi:pimeloyl-ACP methyl ester carboxylesterase